MPRIRTIKPEALQHRKICALSDRAFRVWVTLLTQADDAGRVVSEADQIRIWGFGGHAVKVAVVEQAIQEVASCGLIRLYAVKGTRYALFPSWLEHQKISHPGKSLLPEPASEDSRALQSTPEDSGIFHEDLIGSYRIGKEGIGGEGIMGGGTEPPRDVAAPCLPLSSTDALPDWFRECLQGSKNFSSLLAPKHAQFWQTMTVAYDPYEWLKWDEEVSKADAWIEANPQRRPRQVARFLRNWFERAVEQRRRYAKAEE